MVIGHRTPLLHCPFAQSYPPPSSTPHQPHAHSHYMLSGPSQGCASAPPSWWRDRAARPYIATRKFRRGTAFLTVASSNPPLPSLPILRPIPACPPVLPNSPVFLPLDVPRSWHSPPSSYMTDALHLTLQLPLRLLTMNRAPMIKQNITFHLPKYNSNMFCVLKVITDKLTLLCLTMYSAIFLQSLL